MPANQKIDPEAMPWGAIGTTLSGLIILGLTYAFSYVLLIAFISYAKKFGLEIDSLLIPATEYNGFLIALSGLITTPVILILTSLCIYFRKGMTFRDYIGLHPVSFRQIWQWCGILLLVLVVNEVVSRVVGRPYLPEFMSEAYKTSGYPILLLISLVIAVPITEEFFFRGFLMTGFHHSSLGWFGAIIISSFLWSITHFQYGWYDISWIFILGLILGYAKKDTGSIYIPLIMHALVNAIALLGTAAYVDTIK